MLFILQPDDWKCLWFLSKSLRTHQDNIHGHSVMLQWNICFMLDPETKLPLVHVPCCLSQPSEVWIIPDLFCIWSPQEITEGSIILGSHSHLVRAHNCHRDGSCSTLMSGCFLCVLCDYKDWAMVFKATPTDVCSSSDSPDFVQPGNPAPKCLL